MTKLDSYDKRTNTIGPGTLYMVPTPYVYVRMLCSIRTRRTEGVNGGSPPQKKKKNKALVCNRYSLFHEKPPSGTNRSFTNPCLRNVPWNFRHIFVTEKYRIGYYIIILYEWKSQKSNARFTHRFSWLYVNRIPAQMSYRCLLTDGIPIWNKKINSEMVKGGEFSENNVLIQRCASTGIFLDIHAHLLLLRPRYKTSCAPPFRHGTYGNIFVRKRQIYRVTGMWEKKTDAGKSTNKDSEVDTKSKGVIERKPYTYIYINVCTFK